MKRKDLKLKVKNELKELAKEIREMKNQRKKVKYGYVSGLDYASEEYRERHVAYCMYFNNTPYERIESNPREPLEANCYNNIIYDWKKEVECDKTLCSGS